MFKSFLFGWKAIERLRARAHWVLFIVIAEVSQLPFLTWELVDFSSFSCFPLLASVCPWSPRLLLLPVETAGRHFPCTRAVRSARPSLNINWSNSALQHGVTTPAPYLLQIVGASAFSEPWICFFRTEIQRWHINPVLFWESYVWSWRGRVCSWAWITLCWVGLVSRISSLYALWPYHYLISSLRGERYWVSGHRIFREPLKVRKLQFDLFWGPRQGEHNEFGLVGAWRQTRKLRCPGAVLAPGTEESGGGAPCCRVGGSGNPSAHTGREGLVDRMIFAFSLNNR